ncbi:MAG: hypothetical protein IJN96_05545 [Clostridia bacterium]|nr:hypothetical protein [Clostridia bacterium]
MLNILYVFAMLTSGIFFRAYWFYALAAYYLTLIVMRIFVLKNTTEVQDGNLLQEYRRYRLCGIMMLFLNLALVVIVYYAIHQSKELEHSYVYAAAMAVYTFSAIIWAIVSIVRYRRYESPILSAAKSISFVSAVVSLISLESALSSIFGKETDFKKIVLTRKITGITVCAVVLSMALYMIIRANIQLRRLEKKKYYS